MRRIEVTIGTVDAYDATCHHASWKSLAECNTDSLNDSFITGKCEQLMSFVTVGHRLSRNDAVQLSGSRQRLESLVAESADGFETSV